MAVFVKKILKFSLCAIVSSSACVVMVLSVVRLIQRDYGDAGGDAANKAKLNAALIIFYVMVIFQGLCFSYYVFIIVQEPWMLMSKQFGFGIWGPKIVRRYRKKTIDKCNKDKVLPNNWNLITYSVGLLESSSPRDRLWGARVLDTFIKKGISTKQELLSSSQAIRNLMNMIIGSTRRNDLEIRERAARIVADLASELRIAQFHDLLQCICCLLESCMQYSDPEVAHLTENSEQTLDKTACKVSIETFGHGQHQEDAHLSLAINEQTDHKQAVNLASGKVPKRRSWIQTLIIRKGKTRKEMHEWEIYFGDKYHYSYVSKGTKELISQGLVILERLTQDKDNCIQISKHQRLLSKITLPLSYQDLLNHGWENHTWAEMLRRSLTVMSRLIRAGPGVDTTRLRHDMSRNTVAIRNLMCILEVGSEGAFSELHGHAIDILAELAIVDSFRKLAFDESTSMTEMLVKIMQRILLEESNAIVGKQNEEKVNIVKAKAGEALATLLRVPSVGDNTDASISSTNVNIVDLLPKQDMINLLTRVVDQILSSNPEKATRADRRQSSAKENEEQSKDRKMLVVMLSNTVAICTINVISGDDFTAVIPDDVALIKKLKEIVEMDKVGTTDGWRIQKLICQVVIAVVQLKPSCIREFNEHNFKEALSKALEIMSGVDNCMIFAGDDDRKLPVRSLVSLVKEAQELLAQEQGDIISA